MELFQHFRKEEVPFIERVIDWVEEVDDYYAPKRLPFLDPRQQFIVESIARAKNVSVWKSGAFSNAERQRIILAPDYFEPTLQDFHIYVASIDYPKKFTTLKHRDVLGSMMALGVEREQFGDIVIREGDVQVAFTREMETYVTQSWTEVGKTAIVLQSVSPNSYLQPTDEWEEQLHIVSALRLDVLLASILKVSRAQAVKLIKSERVQLNWKKETNVSSTVEPFDMLSIRGHGRYKVSTIEGRTRKSKIRINIGKRR